MLLRPGCSEVAKVTEKNVMWDGRVTYTKSYMNENDDDGTKTAKTVTLKTHTWVDDEERSAKTVVPASHMARHTRIDDEEKKNWKLSHIIPWLRHWLGLKLTIKFSAPQRPPGHDNRTKGLKNSKSQIFSSPKAPAGTTTGQRA